MNVQQGTRAARSRADMDMLGASGVGKQFW